MGRLLTTGLALAVCGCGARTTDPDADADADADADVDSDVDADAGVDGDVDADADRDPDAESDSDEPPGSCQVADGDYGDCEMVLGIAFDGARCRMMSGCSCEPHCDRFFASAVECARACARAGECNDDLMQAAGIARDPFRAGDYCDSVNSCHGSQDDLLALFPDGSCRDAFGGCGGELDCQLLPPGDVGPDAWRGLCAASLLEGVTAITCLVLGP